MKHIKKLTFLVLICLMLCGCNGKQPLDDTRWYTDDINNTVRTVATINSETGKLTVNYVLIDEGRAKRTKVDGLAKTEDEYFYTDFGENIPEEYNDGTDTSAFAVYFSEEDAKSGKSPSVTFYHFEDGNFVINGNVCKPLEGDLAAETDKIIEKNLARVKK